ncbi:hypothetical protein ACTU45_25210 [Streptomyces sp. 24-1644]|uniref:hypothetical protein n=1 Tax=Streptomyces sp. 24-1644 TaxID=3457315 RepID=UPI003FA6E178
MTTAAARTADGPRPARGTADRRALHVVLFLGVLFALGLLFGGGGEAHAAQRTVPEPPVAGPAIAAEADTTAGRAMDRAEQPVRTAAGQPGEAADRPTAWSSPSRSLTTAAAGRVRDASPEPARDGGLAPAAVPERVRSTVAESVRDADRPVRTAVAQSAQAVVRDTVQGTARSTVQRLTGVLGSVTGALPPLPLPPHLVPSAPSVPPVPLLPGTTDAPPVVPSDGEAASAQPGTAPLGSGGQAAQTSSSGSHTPLAGAVVVSDGTDRAFAPDSWQGDGRSPVDPSGGPGRTPAAETHSPRSGDQQAAPVAHGPSFGLVRGAGLPATAAPVRDRSDEILEFPG